MSPLTSITVKIEEELEEALLAIATQRQKESEGRVTVSDVVRDILAEGTKGRVAEGLKATIIRPKTLNSDQVIEVCEPYAPIGRDLLETAPISLSEIHPIKTGITTKSWVIPKRSNVPDMFVDGQELMIPTFAIATHPQWPMREGLSRLDEIVDRAKDSISRIEDEEVFKVISAAAPAEHSLTVLEPVIPSNITVACRLLWEHEVKVANIAYHPRWTNIINEWLREEKDATWPLGQKASEIRCLSSTMCPERTVYILAAAAKVGRIVINIPVTVMNADTPKALRYGRVVWEDLGIAVVNDHCVAKITSVPKNAGLPEPRE